MAGKQRTLGDVSDGLRNAAQVARVAIASTSGMSRIQGDMAASEVAKAVVLLESAAARFSLFCGLPDTQSNASKVRK